MKITIYGSIKFYKEMAMGMKPVILSGNFLKI